MPKKRSDVNEWLKRETTVVRKSLESASGHFDGNDRLTVNTLEAVYARESSFGLPSKMGTVGSVGAAGHFQFKPDAAKRYGLSVTKKNDQRFDIGYASSAAARYLKDLDTFFSKKTTLIKGSTTIGVRDSLERQKFVLGAFNAGERRVSIAQHQAEKAGKNPGLWFDVEKFLSTETRRYVPSVLSYQNEFSRKSRADKNLKQKSPRKGAYRCTVGHWVTIDDRHVFICD